MANPYSGSMEHLFAELKRLDLMLRRAVLIARQTRAADVPDEFRGLVISEDNVSHILNDVDFLGNIWLLDASVSGDVKNLNEELEIRQSEIRARMEASVRAGVNLALPLLAATFNLSPAEVDLLLIALAPELEPRYEILYAYLQNDVTRKRPSIDLCLNLICRNAQEKVRARQFLSDDAPLLRYRVLELREESHDRSPTRLRQFLRVCNTVTRFLLEQQPLRSGAGRLIIPGSGLQELETSPTTRKELLIFRKSIRQNGITHTVIQLWGGDDAPLDEAASALAYELRKHVLTVDLGEIGSDAEQTATLLRDALLWNNLLVLNRGRSQLQEAEQAKVKRVAEHLLAGIVETNLPVVMLSPDEQFGNAAGSPNLWRLRVDGPDFDTRKLAWSSALGAGFGESDLERLADFFSFSGSRVEQTVGLARARATLRDPSSPEPEMSDVLEAGRDLTNPNVSQFAIPIEPRFGWDDLVLPPDEMKQLKGVANRLKYRNLVHRDWQFGSKSTRGRGLAGTVHRRFGRR